jgi:hypothetical protein
MLDPNKEESDMVMDDDELVAPPQPAPTDWSK